MAVIIPAYPEQLMQLASIVEALSVVADDLDSNSQDKMGQLINCLTASLKQLALKISREDTLAIGHSCARVTLHLLQVGLVGVGKTNLKIILTENKCDFMILGHE